MALGNRIGVALDDAFPRDLFAQAIGGIIVELAPGAFDEALRARAGDFLAALEKVAALP
jgi:hypothetical protein